MSTSETHAIVQAFYNAYNGHDASAAAALYTLAGEHNEVAQARVTTGREDLCASLEHFFRAFPDAHWQVYEPVVSASAAAIPYMLTGTLRAQLGPFPGKGQKLQIPGLHLLRITDTRIATSSDYWDGATFTRQMRAD